MTISAVLALGGGVLVSAGPGAASAQPMCDGRAATIVVTYGNQTVEGTAARDVILVDGDYGGLVVRGNGRRDRICGGRNDERLEGGPGDDRIFAGAGTDRLFGGEGDDLLDAGSTRRGDETGFLKAQYLRPGPGRDIVRGVDRLRTNDLVDYSHSKRRLRLDVADPGPGADVLSGIRTIVGTRFDDRIRAAGGREDLVGSGGDDLLAARGGNDYLYGHINRSSDHAGLLAEPGADGDDRLLGGDGIDFPTPGPGQNVVRGGPGNDHVDVFKTRGDRLYGGGDSDYLMMTSDDAIRLDLRVPPEPPDSSIEGFEAYELVADSGRVHGTDGDDRIFTRTETHRNGDFVVHGHGGDDELAGTVMIGGPGNDDLRDGREGRGGSGDDRVIWVKKAYGGDGTDKLGGSVIGDGGDENDKIYVGWDLAAGNGPADRPRSYRGGDGDDEFPHLVGEVWRNVEIDGGPGTDAMQLGDNTELTARVDLAAGTEEIDIPPDWLEPNPPEPPFVFEATLAGIENVLGTGGDDVLAGDDQDNELIGGEGDDTIDGRGGADTCEGETVSNCEA
ncbi:MAG: hypothetical protein ACRDO7_17715 [Nocardioidaceae bacterium]